MPTLYTSPYRITPLLTMLLLGLTACTPTTDTFSDNDVDNTSEVRVDERMATDISPSGSFTSNSYDNIKIGATFDPQILTQNTEILEGCFQARSTVHPDASYMIIDNEIVEIGTSESAISSAYGVTVGDSLEQLYAKHDGQSPEVEGSPYGNPDENIIIYYWYEDNGKSSEQRIGTKYQVDNDIVTSISIGLESALRLWEGCA